MSALSPPTARENGLNLNSSPSSQLFPESCSKQVTWELALGPEWPVFVPVTRGVVGRGRGGLGCSQRPPLFRVRQDQMASCGSGILLPAS